MVKANCICGFEYEGISYPDVCPKCGLDKFKMDKLHKVEE